MTALPPEIGRLNNLGVLSLECNPLTALPPAIGQLSNLTLLILSDTQLTALPPEIGRLNNLTELFLDNNLKLTSPPPEILRQGTKATLAFLQARLQDSQQQWISKLLFVGQGGVGKTSLRRTLRGVAFEPQESTTHGIEITPLQLAHPEKPEVTMRLNAWDFGGQDIYHATHQFFLTDRSLFLLTWNARHGYEQGKLYYWLDTIQALAPESPVLIVATHIDQRDADLPLAELRHKYPQIIGHCAVSNLTRTGCERLREQIAAAAAKLPLMGEAWPASWLKATNAIQDMPEKYITFRDLEAELLKHGLKQQDAQILAQWLHELGEILFFPENPDLKDIVILKPQWVAEYISRVLENEEVIRENGIFTRDCMDRIWQELPPQLRQHFLRLMERFDLSYRTLENQDISLVVERLPLDPPDYEWQWRQIVETKPCNEISMQFQLSTIPAGIPTWFIARSHRFTTHTHWRNGTLFAYDSERKHIALVQAFPQERYLQLTVRGSNPQNFFALLKDGIEVTLTRFPGLRIKRLIPCPGHNGTPCGYLFNYAHLERAIQRNPPILEIQCQETFEPWLTDKTIQRHIGAFVL